MSEVKIIEAVEIFSPEPARVGKKDALITYTVDKVHTYLITVPAEDATEDKIMEKIRTAEQARAKLVGKTFEV